MFNARAAALNKRNLVIIMLRGGMDGLTAVPPRDRILSNARPDILVKETLKLTSDFDLHPGWKPFMNFGQRVMPALSMLPTFPTGTGHISRGRT